MVPQVLSETQSVIEDIKNSIDGVPPQHLRILEAKFDTISSVLDEISPRDSDGEIAYDLLEATTIRAEQSSKSISGDTELTLEFLSSYQTDLDLYLERLQWFANKNNGGVTIEQLTLELKRLVERTARDFFVAYMRTRIQATTPAAMIFEE